jgi:integrase
MAEQRGRGRIAHYVCHPDGKPVGALENAWKTACNPARPPGKLVHDLRRTAVRNLVRAGVSEHVAMELSGH